MHLAGVALAERNFVKRAHVKLRYCGENCARGTKEETRRAGTIRP